jgi:hypothetical protein
VKYSYDGFMRSLFFSFMIDVIGLLTAICYETAEDSTGSMTTTLKIELADIRFYFCICLFKYLECYCFRCCSWCWFFLSSGVSSSVYCMENMLGSFKSWSLNHRLVSL